MLRIFFSALLMCMLPFRFALAEEALPPGFFSLEPARKEQLHTPSRPVTAQFYPLAVRKNTTKPAQKNTTALSKKSPSAPALQPKIKNPSASEGLNQEQARQMLSIFPLPD